MCYMRNYNLTILDIFINTSYLLMSLLELSR